MIGIYKITNLLTGETYIGQSTNLEQRFKEHIYHNESYIDESVKDRCSFNTLQSILWGRYYSNVIVYDKKNKKWINK